MSQFYPGEVAIIIAGRSAVAQCELVQRIAPMQKNIILRDGTVADSASPFFMWEVIHDPEFVTIVREMHLLKIGHDPDRALSQTTNTEEILEHG